MSFARIISLWAPVVAFMALLILLPGQSAVPALARVWDKLLHAGAFGILGLLALRAFHGGIARPRGRPTVLALLLTLGYGLFDEYHQLRVPGREASALDWLADAVGAGLSVPLAGLLARFRRSRDGGAARATP